MVMTGAGGLFNRDLQTSLTVDDVNILVEYDLDGGLSHVYRTACFEVHTNPHTNRIDTAPFTLAYSPPTIRMVELYRE